MQLNRLVGKGYFPIELPPPFNTELLGNVADHMTTYFNRLDPSAKKEYNETLTFSFSVPKVGLSRRRMGIPNPVHQIELSKIICDNWVKIQEVFDRSEMSSSKQVEDDSDIRACKMIDTFGEYKEKCLIHSFDKVYELQTDISKYFPSIYTHSIPWAIHSKAIAKSRRRDDTLFGNLLDTSIRKGQSGQTIGIPIGPDTSRIISELLGCTFDQRLKSKFKSLVGFRYVDDCSLFFNSRSDAEKVFKHFQSVLTEYGLDINEEKTKIKKLPFSYESHWTIELSNYQIRKSKKGQRTDLKNFIRGHLKNTF